MTDKPSERVGRLVDDLESGKLSVPAFFKAVREQQLPEPGVGPYVRPPAAEGPSVEGFRRTGVVVRIQMVDAGQGNLIEGLVRPNPAPFWQTFRTGDWEQQQIDGTATIVVARQGVARFAQQSLRPGQQVRISPGERFRISNKGQQPARFEARHPMWLPDIVVYQYGQRTIPGSEMWFELKTSADDDIQRPIYNVISAGGDATFVAILVPSGMQTIPQYDAGGDNVVTIISGQADLRVDADTRTVARGEATLVPAGQQFQISQPNGSSSLVEVRPDVPRMWNPDDSYWELEPGKFVPGNEVFFEFVLPA